MKIRSVFRKELLEVLRDRRTLIAMVLVPVVLYPVLILGMLQLAHGQQRQRDAETVKVGVRDPVAATWLADQRDRVEADRARRIDRLQVQGLEVAEPETEVGGIEPVVVEDIHEAVRDGRLPVALDIIGSVASADPQAVPVLKVIVNHGSDRSREAAARLQRLLIRLREVILRDAAASIRGVGTFEIASENQAPPDASLRWVLAKIAPIILILMTVTGAIYPAIDLTAGERERGTLETLMVCPVPVVSLIVGKFLVVMTVALMSATLNLASIGATVYFIGVPALFEASGDSASFQVGAESESAAEGDAPAVGLRGPALLGVCATILFVMIPFAVFTSALLLAVCSFARTFKEAQNYIAPVLLVCLIPCFVAALPDTQLAGPLLVMPVANMVLLTRELLLGHFDVGAMATVLLSSTLYATAAVALATKLFGQEAVVFSDSASWRSALDRRLMRSAALPSPAQVLVITSLLFPVNFYVQQSFQSVLGSNPARYLAYAALTIVAVMGVVPLLSAAYFKIEIRNTFRLRGAGMRFWLAGLLLGLSGWVLSHEILILQSRVFALPEAFQSQNEQLTQGLESMHPAVVLLLLAIVPGVCEELFFRGFLLSGLSARSRRGVAIVVSAAVFAVYHVLLWRFAVTFTLGLLLGWLCWQGRSVIPALVAHALYNASVLGLQLFPKITTWLRLDEWQSDAHLPAPHLGFGVLAFIVFFLLTRRPAISKETHSNPGLDSRGPEVDPISHVVAPTDQDPEPL